MCYSPMFSDNRDIANVAEGRVTILLDSLTQAFSRGFTGDDPEEGQLKVSVRPIQ